MTKRKKRKWFAVFILFNREKYKLLQKTHAFSKGLAPVFNTIRSTVLFHMLKVSTIKPQNKKNKNNNKKQNKKEKENKELKHIKQ